MTHAYDGYALANGIDKPDNPNMYPDEESRARLRKLEKKSMKAKVNG